MIYTRDLKPLTLAAVYCPRCARPAFALDPWMPLRSTRMCCGRCRLAWIVSLTVIEDAIAIEYPADDIAAKSASESEPT